MKRLCLICLVLFSFSLANAQDSESKELKTDAYIEFEKTTHEFGDIKQGDKVEYVFKFKNTGTKPLVLSEVVPSCGCTSKKFTQEPVPPGGEGEVHIIFNSAHKMGRQNKVVTVLSNASNNPIMLRFTGNVLPAESTGSAE